MDTEVDDFCFRGRSCVGRKLHRTEDVHTVRAETVLERTRPFWSRVGLTRLADITGMDRLGVPTVNAIRPTTNGVSTQHGKGLTLAAAKASAVMETFERFHARNIPLPQQVSSYAQLTQEKTVIEPDALFTRMGLPFDPDRMEHWVEAFDMVAQVDVAIPYALAATGPSPNKDRTQFPIMSTNGFAAGGNLVEAALQGLCECVERDAGAFAAIRTRSGRGEPRRIILDTIPFPEVRELLARVRESGLFAVMRDMRQDVDIFVCQCSLYDPSAGCKGVTTGAGCSLNPAVAMIRAVTEAAQARCVLHTGNREVMFGESYFLFRNIAARGAERMLREAGDLDVSSLRAEDTPTFEGDFAECLKRLAAAGFEQVLLLDLGPEDIDISVVRVFVPGLVETPFGLSRLGRRIRTGRL